jgi:holo-[acyl-carrier protein] synthase
MSWHDCEVLVGERGNPFLELRDSVASAAHAQGVQRWHLSLTHDGDNAVAMVIAEGN